MASLPENQILIGVDGGASEVKAHQVLLLSEAGAPSLALGPASASACYERVEGFEPQPVARQVLAFERGDVAPTDIEAEQGGLWLEAVASSILAVASQAESNVAVIGVCLPGLKTKDGRGVAVMRNGPRLPDFLDVLERRLIQGGLVLSCPIPPLLSDGDACTLGEETDAHGLLRGVSNAYYLGGGTGLAEGLKLAGEMV